MFKLPFLIRATYFIPGERVILRSPHSRHYREWARLRRESRSFLQPWEPLWSGDELEKSSWHRRVRRSNREWWSGSGYHFLIFDRDQNRLVGGITLGNVRRGVAQTGQIGYWMGQKYSGQGLMHAAVCTLLPFAFQTLALNRVEAACIPSNERSIRVLEKAGFTREGLARSYLRINGIWQDHLLYALVASDSQPSAAKTLEKG